MACNSDAASSSSSKKRKYNVCCDKDREALRSLVDEVLDCDSDYEIDDEIERETASDNSSGDESESESESDLSAANGWKEVGANDRRPAQFNYMKNAGPKLNLPADADPIQYFLLFFNDDIMNDIINETNRYAREKISKLQLSPRSIWHKWSDVNLIEMRAFLGLVINMGLISLPDIKDYWSGDWTTNIKFFGDVMSRDRFLQIFWMLHVGNDNIQVDNEALKRTQKIHGIIEKIEKLFHKYFIPGRNIAIDESTVGFKGKILFKTYNPKKPTKWGIRIFVLADSDTGYVHSIIPYYGKHTGEVCNLPYPDKSFTSRIVLSLMDRLGLCTYGIDGYHLFTDRYYSSVELAQQLVTRQCHTTGTIIAGRVGNPNEIRQGALKKLKKSGDTCAFRNGNVLVMGWKDKRVVLMVSTLHNTEMEKKITIQKGGQRREVEKPACVLDYTKNMGGVDRNDHYCATYAFIRKSLKWWRKLFFWCLEVCIVNSYILYCCLKTQQGAAAMSHVKYRRALVESLVGDTRNPRKRSHHGSADREERLNKFPHFIYHYEQKKHKDCIVCSNRKVKGGRKETYYYCKTCSNQPAMCPGDCFERYHTLKIFKTY